MSFIATKPNVIDFGRNQPAYQPQQTIGGAFGQGLGAGIGDSLSGMIQNRLKQSMLDKVLAKSGSQQSPLEKYFALHQVDPKLARGYAPVLQQELKQQQAQQEAQALGGFYNQQFGGGQQPETQPQQIQQQPMQGESQQMQPQQGIDFTQLQPKNQKVVGDILLQQQKMSQDQKLARQAEESEISTPILQNVEEGRHTIPIRKHAAKSMKEATLKGNLALGKDYIADLSGIEALRSPEGALFKTAGKEFLLGSIGRVGGRPNQWVEQQIATMAPQVGRSREANLSVAEALDFETDTSDIITKKYDELSEKFRNELGYVPARIGALVSEEVKPLIKQREAKLAYDLQRIHEQENPKDLQRVKKVSPGTPLTVEKAKVLLKKANGDEARAMRIAEQAGYTIPDASFYEEQQ